MSIELLYTSATAGLRQGSRGFCTVISTSGMPINLASKLESLSGYRHVYLPQDANADENPVCHSHLKVKVGGKSSSVLSRTSAFGVDYSGRTNKLAHHVVVEPHEQSPAGPAWVLAQASIMRDDWDGKNATPSTGPMIPQSDQHPGVCAQWKAMMGDAGWGGVVADAMASPTGKPTWIIFDVADSDKLLPLIGESIALLPPSQRWSATFSTYFTSLPPEIDCRVRCVVAGSEEARLAAARGTVIDLTKPLLEKGQSPLIELARTGPQAAKPAPPTRSDNFRPRESEVAAPSVGLVLDEDFDKPELHSRTELRLGPPTRKPPAVSSKSHQRPTGPPPTLAKRKKSPAIWAVAAIAGTILFGGVALVFLKRGVDRAAAQISGLATIGRATVSTPSTPPPISVAKPGVAADKAAEWIKKLESEFGKLESKLKHPETALPVRPGVAVVNANHSIDDGLLNRIETALDLATKNKGAQGEAAKGALDEISKFKELDVETLSRIESILADLQEVKRQIESQIADVEVFNAAVEKQNHDTEQISNDLNKLEKNLDNDEMAGAVATRVDDLRSKVLSAIQACKESLEIPIGDETSSGFNTAVKEIGMRTEQWEKARRSVDEYGKIKVDLEKQSLAFEDQQRSETRKSRTISICVIRTKDKWQIKTDQALSMPVSNVNDLTESRWIALDESDPISPKGSHKVEWESGHASIQINDSNYSLFALQLAGTTGTVSLEYAAISMKERSTHCAVDRHAIELLNSIAELEDAKQLFTRWGKQQILTSENDKPDDPVNVFNKITDEAKALATTLTWKTCDADSVAKIDSLIERISGIQSDDFAKANPSCPRRKSELAELKDALNAVVVHRNFLTIGDEMKELRLGLFGADKTKSNNLGRYSKLLHEVSLQPIVQLNLEASQE